MTREASLYLGLWRLGTRVRKIRYHGATATSDYPPDPHLGKV